MSSRIATTVAAVLAIAACSKTAQTADAPSAPRTTTTANASASAQNSVEWGPAPAALPPGAQIAVLQGDPGSNSEFTIRLKFPNGYRIPPHTHPTTENVTVLSGTFLAGMGTQFVESNLQAFQRDGFSSLPAGMAHYAMARGETVIQLHAIGPFAINYINQADVAR
jgi:anti-sigma factor ChrR (cupin superfamily)